MSQKNLRDNQQSEEETSMGSQVLTTGKQPDSMSLVKIFLNTVHSRFC